MLEYLFDINWSDLETAYGGADTVPDQLLRLNSPKATVRSFAQWELYGNVYHQGSIYLAAAFAIPFLVEIFYLGENCNKGWIQGYIDDISMWNWEERAEEYGFDPKTTEVPYNLHNVRKICYEVCDKESGYGLEAFAKVKEELIIACEDAFDNIEEDLQDSPLDIGKAYLEGNRPGMAIDHFKKALSLNPEQEPLIHSLIGYPAFLIGDFDQAYESIGIVIDKKPIDINDVRLYGLFIFLAPFNQNYDRASQHLQAITKKLLPETGLDLESFLKVTMQTTSRLGLHLQNCGLWDIKTEEVFSNFMDFLLEKLDHVKNIDERYDILEQVYLINELMYPPRKLDLPEFQTTEGLILMFDNWIQNYKGFWTKLNAIGWERFQSPLARAISKQIDKVEYDSLKIGEYLIDLGKRIGDDTIRCFGMDLSAAVLVESSERTDFLRAKEYLEEAKSINEQFYTPENYSKVLEKIDNL